jgi:hypothetical protein
MSMKNLYYLIWNDSISSIRRNRPHDDDWKRKIFLHITFINSLNIWIVLIWLHVFGVISFVLLDIKIFSLETLDGFFSFLCTCFFPVGILNYFLIFYNNRYENILNKYKNVKTRYGRIYSLVIPFLLIISAYLHSYLIYK